MKNSLNIKKYLAKQESKISEAIKILQKNPIKIVIIICNQGKLLGTITDGDIRRGLLHGYTLDDKCSCIMNKRPNFAYVGDLNNINKILIKKQLVPVIVDKNKVVISIDHNDTYTSKIIKTNKVVIMAGGKGKRLMPLTQNTPKPLLTINDKPIVEYTIEAFIKNGFEDIILSVGYKSEKLINYFNSNKLLSKYITYINEDKPLDTAGSLSLISKKELKEPVIVKNGDMITNVNYDELLKFHNNHNKPITICASEYKISIPFGSINSKDGVISEIIEKPTIKHHINAGIYVINPEIIKNMKKNTAISMVELLDNYIGEGNVIAYPLYESWIDIGSPEDFKKAQMNTMYDYDK